MALKPEPASTKLSVSHQTREPLSRRSCTHTHTYFTHTRCRSPTEKWSTAIYLSEQAECLYAISLPSGSLRAKDFVINDHWHHSLPSTDSLISEVYFGPLDANTEIFSFSHSSRIYRHFAAPEINGNRYEHTTTLILLVFTGAKNIPISDSAAKQIQEQAEFWSDLFC